MSEGMTGSSKKGKLGRRRKPSGWFQVPGDEPVVSRELEEILIEQLKEGRL